MTTQDETILHAGQENQTKNEKKQDNRQTRWQSVTMGGITGIAMGAAGVYAVDALAAGNQADDGQEAVDAEEVDTQAEGTQNATDVNFDDVHMAHVSPGLSFAEAFDAARAEVGAGGVFLWHGRLYNTFTADEWQGMSDAQRNEFADGVQPYLSQQAPVQHTVQHTEHVETRTVNVSQTVETHEPEHEVHFLGVQTINTEDGDVMNVGRMSIDHTDVALVDLDNDRVFDIRIKDENHNGQWEREEVDDISDRQLDVDTFEMISLMDGAANNEAQLDHAVNPQEDLAPDMPDYMNDANVDAV